MLRHLLPLYAAGFWRKKRIGAPAPTLLLFTVTFALLLRSGCRYEFIDEAPLVGLSVQVLDVFQV